MKLLIVTQTIDSNDPALGFFHRWVEEFAKHCDHVEVICLGEGKYSLPRNVSIHSLGKEQGRASRLQYGLRFVDHIWKLRSRYDVVFIHMNPEYILLGGGIWKLLGKRVYLWYTHKSTPWYLRASLPFVSALFTASKESFRINSSKVQITGHGISIGALDHRRYSAARLISVGRISHAKHTEVIIDAFNILRKSDLAASLTLIGEPVTDKDNAFYKSLYNALVREEVPPDSVFLGARPHSEINAHLARADYFLHASETGSLDKAVLEAIAQGVIPVSSSEAYGDLFQGFEHYLRYPAGDSMALTERIQILAGLSEQERIRIARELHERLSKDHSLQKLIPRILGHMTTRNTSEAGDFYKTLVPSAAQSYEQERWKTSPIRQAHRDMQQSFLKSCVRPLVRFATRYLEIGPGPGTWTQSILAYNPKLEITLVDISESMLAQASAAIAPHTVSTEIADMSLWRPSGRSFDFVFSSRALEYVSDIEHACNSVAEALAPNGSGVIITKHPHYIRERILRPHKKPGIHGGQIVPVKITTLLKNEGLKVEGVYPVTMTFPLVRSALLSRLLFNTIGRFPLSFLNSWASESYAVVFRKSVS